GAQARPGRRRRSVGGPAEAGLHRGSYPYFTSPERRRGCPGSRFRDNTLMDLTVQNVYGLLIRSKLLSLDECKDLFTRWNQEAKDNATNLGMFARWVVANKFLTEYQATLLARGHAEGFFLNGYKIIDRLGKGRMAGVYKAQHETGPIIAIKVLPPSKARDSSLFARFQ